jgi:Zn ribbon nucleic-acid-binding protein
MKITEDDLSTVIIKDEYDTTYSLLPYNYFAAMAGYAGRKFESYDRAAQCIKCSETKRLDLWLWCDESGMGHWECTSCLLEQANESRGVNRWYVLMR